MGAACASAVNAVGLERYTLVIEGQQVYRGAPSNVDPNDLLEVAGASGAVVGALKPERVIAYLPRDWCGRVRKVERHERLRAELQHRGLDEQCRIQEPRNKALSHNVLDAVALGIFHLKR